MATDKLKLYIRSLTPDDLVDKISKTNYNDISDTIRQLNISGDNLLELNELDVRLKYAKKIDRKQMHRLQLLVLDVQTKPDVFLSNDSTAIRAQSTFQPNAISTFTPNHEKQPSDVFLQEFHIKSKLDLKSEATMEEVVEHENPMLDGNGFVSKRLQTDTGSNNKPVITSKPISLRENLNKDKSQESENKLPRQSDHETSKLHESSKVYVEEHFEYVETVEYKNSEEILKEQQLSRSSIARPSSSTEYIILTDADDLPVYEEIANEEVTIKSRHIPIVEWSITGDINKNDHKPPPLPQRDEQQLAKQSRLRNKTGRKPVDNGDTACNCVNLIHKNEPTDHKVNVDPPENKSEALQPSESDSFYEVPVTLKYPSSNIYQHPFFRDVTRIQGNSILLNSPIGTYLLRKSANKGFFAVLMVKTLQKILNVPIAFETNSNEYWLETQDAVAPMKFKSIIEMLRYYSQVELNGCKLLSTTDNIIL